MNELLVRLLNLPPEASTYAPEVDWLHFAVISTTMLGAAFVFLLALYFLLRYRRRVPGETTAHTTTSTPQEVLIIGGILSLFLLFWVVGSLQYNHMLTPPDDAMTVYVTGKQWMWKFSYTDGRSTMDVLTVPTGRPVRLVMTSRDVIHSFYVPAFRMKHDVVPGRYYTAWFEARAPGSYPIECAEYCGVSHSRMLGEVHVLAPEAYAQWLVGQPPRTSDLVEAGRDVAARRGCLNCHTLDGQPHIGPTWAGLYGSQVQLQGGVTVVADGAYLTRSMMDPQADVVAGYRSVMPTYRGILEQPEVAALLELMRSLQTQPYSPSITLPKVIPQGSAMPQAPPP
ncbi:MAG TPA: cytochrome c oxidase subunit II [Polyangiaceae bacterium]|jgi:cytochrome c oxidase subunit 2